MGDVLFAAPSKRNRVPIYEVLAEYLPGSGCVLEIASGTGQHVEFFAGMSPHLTWQPTEPDPVRRRSITARAQQAGLTNVAPVLDLDVTQPWPRLHADVVYTANLLHISPVEVTHGLIEGAALVLQAQGLLAIYGPFKHEGNHTSAGNAEFDATLRAKNPQWGIRDQEWVEACADAAGFRLLEVRQMPANNRLLLWRR